MKKNKFYIFACLVIGSFLLSSCLKDDEYTPVPVAGLTMINGFPDDQAIMYYIDQRRVEPLPYKTFSGVNLLQGNRNLIIQGSDSPGALIDATVTIEDSTYYSSFAFGTKENPLHIITEDKAMDSDLNAQETGIRFFNLAEAGSQVSLQIGDQDLQPSFQDRAIEDQASATENQSFIVHDSGTFTLTIKDESGDVLVTRDAVKLNANGYYSIVLLGKQDDNATPLYIGVIGQAVN